MVRTSSTTKRTAISATKSKRMPRLSVSVPQQIYDEVKRIAKRDSRSTGWVMRKAVEDLVKAEQGLFAQP